VKLHYPADGFTARLDERTMELMNRQRRRHEAGVTLVEIVVVIALIGVIAAIALPSLLGSKNKAVSASEVNEFFAELRVRQNEYFGENGAYLATGSTEASTFPTTPDPGGQSIVPSAMPATWQTLKVRLPKTQDVRCAYVVIAGTRTTGSVGPQATLLGFTAPAKHWFYILARCNADDDSATDAYFLTTSESTTIATSNDTH
jgi:prepilin-type N-terminal cleavage/methylation domain-containing protein